MRTDFKKSLLADRLSRVSLNPAQEADAYELLHSAGITLGSLHERLLTVNYRQRHLLDSMSHLLAVDFGSYLKKMQPYMTSHNVLELLKQGHSIGAHSIDHPRYSELPLHEQLQQTRESLRFVRERFTVPYRAFAFPSSDAGVSRHFFTELLQGREVDVFFGNQGMQEDFLPCIVQRSSMEKTQMRSPSIWGQAYSRRVYKMLTGKLRVVRD